MHLVRAQVISATVGESGGAHRVAPPTYRALFAYMRECDEAQRRKGEIALKPPKELTPAFNDYVGLSLATADKIEALLAGDDPEQDYQALREEVIDELGRQCADIMDSGRNSLPHQLLTLRASLRRWREGGDCATIVDIIPSRFGRGAESARHPLAGQS
jgi:hypothetical protein